MKRTYFLVIIVLSIVSTTSTLEDGSKSSQIGAFTDKFKDFVFSVYESLDFSFSQSNQTILGEDYDSKREKFIKEANKDYFTVDVPELTPEEQKVDQIFQELRSELVQGDHSPLLLPYYEGKEVIQDSKLHQAFRKMPKGAHLHMHPSAAFPMDLIKNLTYKEDAYYSMEKNLLRTYSDESPEVGFSKCNDLRKNWSQDGNFDDFLKEKLLLTAEEMSSQESNQIWANFQPKFSLLSGLFKSPENFRLGLLEICKRALSEGVYVVEFRKGLGGDIDQTLGVYQSVLEEMKTIDPAFEITLIIASGKVSEKAVQKQLDMYNYARQRYSFVTGFDLVGEEDKLHPVYDFKDMILQAQEQADQGG